MDVFIKPFGIDTWISLALYSVLILLGYVSVQLGTHPFKKSQILKEISTFVQHPLNLLFRSLLGKRISNEPLSNPNRVLFVALVFCGFFIITLYRAILVAFITVNEDVPPVNSLSDIKNSKYRLAVLRHSSYDDLFNHADVNTEEYILESMKKVIRFMVDSD